MNIYLVFLFLISFLISNATEYSRYEFYNSLIAHYNPGDEIYVKNESTRPICLFNQSYFITNEGIKYYKIGIVINPGVQRTVDLSKIVSSKKIPSFGIYDYYAVRSFLRNEFAGMIMSYLSECPIKLNATYIISEISDGSLKVKMYRPEK